MFGVIDLGVLERLNPRVQDEDVQFCGYLLISDAYIVAATDGVFTHKKFKEMDNHED